MSPDDENLIEHSSEDHDADQGADVGEDRPPAPFESMAEFAAIPRVGALALSADGTRLIASVAQLNQEKTKWTTALWALDPAGAAPARRLTRGREGESKPTFLPDGSVLFTSTRANPDHSDDTEKKHTLWCLPPDGEAKALLTRAGGFSAVVAARTAGTIAYAADTFGPATPTEQEDEARKARKDAGVTAILHESYPIRSWDHDVGPSRPRIVVCPALRPDLDAEPFDEGLDRTGDLGPLPNDEYGADLQISADGSFLVVTRFVSPGGAFDQHAVLDRIDVESGAVHTLAQDSGISYASPAISPDGTRVAVIATTVNTWDDPGADTLSVIDLTSGEVRQVASAQDWQPASVSWSADSAFLLVTVDERGHRPVYRVDLDTDRVTRLTRAGAYASVVASPDGTALYALRDHIDCPPTPVRLDPAATDQTPAAIPAPGQLEVPGTLREVISAGDDGEPIRSWLVLPAGATDDSPVPLLLWIHGGPHASWNAWSWRWNPWLMAAKGYAVLLPDPALSTGYGHQMMRRSYGAWGDAAYTDLMNATTAAEGLPEIDQTRVAAMGGSFGGYMANWVATKTDRFRAIITHASLWDLDHFASTTDFAPYWMRQFGDPLTTPERYRQNSPHLGLANIRTPMLVIHGDTDYRVPIGQGLRLWTDLQRAGVPGKFLYYPDENHWVLTPGNHAVWYETVWAFLDTHVHGKDWVRPANV